MQSLLIVQHCQSEHHVNGMTGGWTDTPLTELGRRQAGCLGRRLQRELGTRPCRIYSSDLRRAYQTAQIVAEQLGRSPIPMQELRESNDGIATGKTRQWAQQHIDHGDASSWDWRPFPRAETWREFGDRVRNGMVRLQKDHPAGELPIIVTHGGTLTHIICWWLWLQPGAVAARTAFQALPGSISLLSTGRCGQPLLACLNDTAHLHAEGIAGWGKLGEWIWPS